MLLILSCERSLPRVYVTKFTTPPSTLTSPPWYTTSRLKRHLTYHVSALLFAPPPLHPHHCFFHVPALPPSSCYTITDTMPSERVRTCITILSRSAVDVLPSSPSLLLLLLLLLHASSFLFVTLFFHHLATHHILRFLGGLIAHSDIFVWGGRIVCRVAISSRTCV